MLYPLLTLCIIAQLCASALFIMHKANFFHFLHKRENPSFLAFGQNDSFWLGRRSFVHTVYVFKVVFYVFWMFLSCFGVNVRLISLKS